MYCSNDNGEDCTLPGALTRVGLNGTDTGLEQLFHRHVVDVVITAHEHSYERLFPMFDYQVYNGSLAAPYTNPGAPVHLISGAAGNKEGRENFTVEKPAWSAFRNRVSADRSGGRAMLAE